MQLMFKFKLGILPRLFIAIAVGIAIGLSAPAPVIRALNCFGGTFGQFIRFFVPFIVLGLVAPAIAETGKGAGRLLLTTMGIAYVSTLFAGGMAFCAADAIFPRVIAGTTEAASQVQSFPAYFILEIPPVMGITSALFTAFIFGLAMVRIDAPSLKRVFMEMRDVVVLTINKAFMPLLPVYILAVMADLTASGKLAAVGGSCIVIMVTAFCVTSLILIVQYLAAGLGAGRNPFRAL